MDSTLPFIIWLVCVGLAAIILGFFIRQNGLEWLHKKEGFQVKLPNIRITMCPSDTQKYITEEGDTNCCEGDVVNGRCNGREVCSLSPSTVNGVKTCSEWLINEWTRRGAKFCSQSMPYYFGDMERSGSEGCSASESTDDGAEPQLPNAKRCKIYKTQNDELAKPDSCTNVIAEDTMICPQKDALKYVQPQPGSPAPPALLTCTYTPKNHSSNDLPVNCYEPIRYQLYMTAKGITKPIDPLQDVQFCPASKAYYVDNTLSVSSAVGLPAGACPTAKATEKSTDKSRDNAKVQPPASRQAAPAAPMQDALAALMSAQGTAGKDDPMKGMLSKLFQK